MNSTEKQIESLKHKIATYTEVAASDADLIKELLASARPDDLQFAAEKAESIARHIARIPAMEAEIEALQANLK